MQNKIRTDDLSTMALIHSAYYRSLMIYYLVPLFAAGAITEKEIDMIEAEAEAKKKQFGLKGDLQSASIQKVLNFSIT